MRARTWSFVAFLAVLSFGNAWSMPSPDPQAIDDPGWKVQEHLQRRFDETRYDCGRNADGYQHPAFLCSGILMRSTNFSSKYHSWLPNPANAAWGVSFSWLRQDSNFPENYPSGNGFIIYPWFHTPKGYEHLLVRCAYPQDAWTGSPDRCKTAGQPICQDQGVFSDGRWILKRFDEDENQCAFGVEDSRQTNTATAWMQMVEVRQEKQYFVRNEIVIAAWPQDVGARMPVEAFFYRDNCFYTDNDCGKGADPKTKLSRADSIVARREAARNDQKDFLNVTGRWVAIVRWTPATSMQGRATFDYRKEDQAVPEPELKK